MSFGGRGQKLWPKYCQHVAYEKKANLKSGARLYMQLVACNASRTVPLTCNLKYRPVILILCPLVVAPGSEKIASITNRHAMLADMFR